MSTVVHGHSTRHAPNWRNNRAAWSSTASALRALPRRVCAAGIYSAVLVLALSIAFAPVSGHLAQLAASGVTVSCCCGEHAISDGACDCPTCPSRHFESDRDQAERGDPLAMSARLRSCAQTGDEIVPIEAIALAEPPSDTIIAPPPVAYPSPPADIIPKRAHYRPESPPS